MRGCNAQRHETWSAAKYGMRQWINLFESEHSWETLVWQIRNQYAPNFQGSCEAAASDLAELLRAQGVPCRIMQGSYDCPSEALDEDAQAPRVPQYLYHGTTLYALVKIISEDLMVCSQDDENTGGVFASPSYTRAKDYGEGVIVFDTGLIDVPIFPNYYWATPDELEFVIDPASDYLKGVTRYIDKVIVQRHDLEALKKLSFENEHSESDWMNHFNYDGNGHARWEDALGKFLAFPRLVVQ